MSNNILVTTGNLKREYGVIGPVYFSSIPKTNWTINIIEIENGSINDFNYYDIELKMQDGLEVLG